MIDFDAIKARHDIAVVLASRYNVVMKRASGGWLVKCPIHGEQKGASFSVNQNKQLWRCHGKCQAGGSVLDLVMAMEDCSTAVEAAEKLEGRALTDEDRAAFKPKPHAYSQQFTSEREDARAAMPLPKMFRADQLKEDPMHYFDIIAKARKLHRLSIKMAHDAGCLRFCQVQWRAGGEKFNCYAILDAANPVNVQFRRMDCYPDDHPIVELRGKALPFWGDTKVMGWKGNQGNWPVGIDVAIANPKATIMLVEGTGDFLAAWDIRALGHDIIPVGIFGASNAINPNTLTFFERRKVIIAQQHDPACALAVERWTKQLADYHANVRTWLVPEEGADLNDYISVGGDVELILNVKS